MSASPRLAQLSRERPECEPWLRLLGETFSAAQDDAWTRMVAAAPAAGAGGGAGEHDRSLLAAATLGIDVAVVRRHVERLLATAADVTRSRATSVSIRVGDVHAVSLLAAAIAQDSAALDDAAASAGIEPGVAHAIAPLVALPLLQAHARAWAGRVSAGWMRPWCPVCGAWPGLAEVRGLDRTRRFRCVRCSSDWHAEWLACPYCGNREHTQLGALVSADSPETRKAETCKRCLGYVKSVTTLQASGLVELAILDVETIELDVAAVEHGYRRPDGPGHALGVRIEPKRPRGLFAWRR